MSMKHFTIWELREAEAYAALNNLNLALHCHNVIVNRSRAPACFVREVDAGRNIAHLFCQDESLLIATAKRLGVKVILVERRGGRGQHIDLCGGPLRKAMAECERAEMEELSLFRRDP